MSRSEDAQLVRATLRGDHRAFEALVDKYQKPILNVAFRMAQDPDDAQDITQTVFIKAFEKLDTYNPRYKFFSWIYRMAINECINFLNQKKPYEELDPKLVSPAKPPDVLVDEHELSAIVGAALMRLPIKYRTILVLKHFEHLSYKDISYIVDTPVKTVKSRLYTARQQLKNVLMKQGLLTP